MDDLFNAAWNNIGLNSDSADWLLNDGTTDASGQYAVQAPVADTGSGGWLGGIWDSITGTAYKVVDYWGQSVVARNTPAPPVYLASAGNPYPYQQPPVDQAAAQNPNGDGSSNTLLLVGGVLAAVAAAALFLKK